MKCKECLLLLLCTAGFTIKLLDYSELISERGWATADCFSVLYSLFLAIPPSLKQ